MSGEVFDWLTSVGLATYHSQFMDNGFNRLDAVMVRCGLIVWAMFVVDSIH